MLLLDPNSKSARAAVNIDSCGCGIPDREVGVLTTDLHCNAGTTAITLGAGATLDLNGHSIDVPNGWGVWCLPAAKCTVVGGVGNGELGEIRGASAGVYLQNRARATIGNILIRDCETGVLAEDWRSGRKGARVRLTNVQITGCTGAGVGVGFVKAQNVIVTDNPGSGILATSLSLLKARGLTVTRNATSATCDVVGCTGIHVGDVKGSSLHVSENAGIGIKALTVKLRDSIVVDNRRLGALRGMVVSERPRLRNVACDTSFSWETQGFVPWGSCSLDGTE